MLFLLYSDGGFHPSPHSTPIRKERNRVLQLLFIDTQVGSIATGLEAAAVVGKMGGWSVPAATAECRNRRAQRTRGKWGRRRGVEKQVRARASLLKLEPLPYAATLAGVS